MQKGSIQHYTVNAMVAVLMLLMVGCAATQRKNVSGMEELLAAAGFQKKPADTPERLVRLKGLPQHRLFTRRYEGGVHYVYADAQFCKCVYVGDERAYQRYQTLALARRTAEEDRLVEQRDQPDRFRWGEWRFNDDW